MLTRKELRTMTKEKAVIDPKLLAALREKKPLVWTNEARKERTQRRDESPFSPADLQAARDRYRSFSPIFQAYLGKEDLIQGQVESALEPLENFQAAFPCGQGPGAEGQVPGSLYAKRDDSLALAGSIKARGGFYELVCRAVFLLEEAGQADPISFMLDKEKSRAFFSDHRLVVGSTGNLGLSIGLMGRKLGFKVQVHMSQEAARWKKDLLRKEGVQVIEHKGDYSRAVSQAREKTKKTPSDYFVDDEGSSLLFLGYASAAFFLEEQIKALGLRVSPDHPLHVYLPCGVGGGPAGIALGLDHIYGPAVRSYYVEPVGAAAMTLALASGTYGKVGLADLGLVTQTAADGLAVGRASALACRATKELVAGSITGQDQDFYWALAQLKEREGFMVEVSAAAALYGYLVHRHKAGSHLVWLTGGRLMPPEERAKLEGRLKNQTSWPSPDSWDRSLGSKLAFFRRESPHEG